MRCVNQDQAGKIYQKNGSERRCVALANSWESQRIPDEIPKSRFPDFPNNLAANGRFSRQPEIGRFVGGATLKHGPPPVGAIGQFPDPVSAGNLIKNARPAATPCRLLPAGYSQPATPWHGAHAGCMGPMQAAATSFRYPLPPALGANAHGGAAGRGWRASRPAAPP